MEKFRSGCLWFAGLAAAACLLPGTASADQLVMKNGDRVTGSIIKQDGKTITIKTDNFGNITAPWDQVASIKSDQPVHVVLKDGKTVVGTLAGGETKLEIAAKDTSIEVNPAEVAAIRSPGEQKAYEAKAAEELRRPGLLEKWAAGASLGLSGANGNAETMTFNSTVNAARTTRTDKTTLTFNMVKASATISGKSADTAQAVRGGIAYDHNVGKRLFVNVFNDYEYDRFQDLDLRFTAGGGLGLHAVKGEHAALDLLGGADFNRSSFSTPLTTSSAEAFWGDQYTLKMTGASSLTQSFRMFNNLSDPGAFRMNFDLGLVTKLRKWLAWNVSLSDRYLSNPVPGRKTNDWLYTTGLGVTFGK